MCSSLLSPDIEVDGTQLELQHLKSMHETLQKEHDGLKQQHQDSGLNASFKLWVN